MTPKRPPGRAPFLGTDDIVRRLREAQPVGLGRFARRLRAAGFAVAVVAATGGIALGMRQTLAGRVFGARSGAAVAAADPQASVRIVSSMPAAEGPANDSAAAAQAHAPEARTQDPAAAAHGHRRELASGHDNTTAVQIRVANAPGPCSIVVDGAHLAQGRRWAGQLGRGRHHVTVRGEQGEQSFVLQLQAHPQEIIFDLTARHAVSRPLSSRPDSGRE